MLVGELLERAARALPAADEERRHGWWVRRTDSSVWWSGATLAHSRSQDVPLEVGVEAAELFYQSYGAPARFQVCAACPTGLDAHLERRGYRVQSPMSLQVADVGESDGRLAATRLGVRVSDRPDSAWFAIWHVVSAPLSSPDAEWRLLHRVRQPSAYVTVYDSDQAIGIARAVVDGGWTGVFGMSTLPAGRRRGAARLALTAIAQWAAARRAARIYLQVDRDNAVARRLYEAAGFTEVATYHYRVRG